jgi:hypothetical protein
MRLASDPPVASRESQLCRSQHAQMRHVPVVGDAVIGAVFAHERKGDAVGKLEIGKFYRREQGTRHD